MTTDFRNSMLAKIHVAKKQLGLTDDEYRDILAVKFGARSAAKLNYKQLHELLEYLSTFGFKAKRTRARKGDKAVPTDEAMSRKAMLTKIHALLTEIGSRQGRHVPWDYAAAILKRMYKVDKLEWAKPDQLRGVIAALHRKAYGTTPQEIAEALLDWQRRMNREDYRRAFEWMRLCTGSRTWSRALAALAALQAAMVVQ